MYNYYIIEKSETGYQLIVTADKNWINGENIKFPVTIDPVITTKTSESAISSTFVSSKMPTTNFFEYLMLLTGVDSYAYNTTRTLVKFQLPQLNNGDIIQSAILNLKQYAVDAYSTNTPAMSVNAYRITNSWNEQTVTWNTKPGYDTNEVDFSYMKKEDGTKLLTKSFDVTKTVKEWYDGDAPNNGIMLRTDKEGTQGTVDSIYAKYYSEKYHDATEAYPIIQLTYRNTKGIEDYYSYTQLEAGSAGTAYVSDYTGNLYFAQNGVATGGLKMPANVYLTHNTNNSHKDKFNTSLKSGWGWKLNVEQFIETTPYPDYPYVYTDEDGTEHYFKKVMEGSTITYQDEDGLGLILKRNADDTYTITDDLDTVMSFTKYGNLLSIKDANGNNNIKAISKLLLRECLWCRLSTSKNDLIIEFGYDFYMYIYCENLKQNILDDINILELFIEEITDYVI